LIESERSIYWSVKMSRFQIKLLALVTMIIDHIGQFFFPNLIILRIIGRLSFPLFAFLIADGMSKTKNVYKFLSLVSLFAFLSQLPFFYASKLIDPNFNQTNVLFTFAIAIMAIIILQKITNTVGKVALLIFCIYLSFLLKVNYGIAGVLIVVSYYFFSKKLFLAILIHVLISISSAFYPAISSSMISLNKINFGPLISLLSIPFIYLYVKNNSKKKQSVLEAKFKYFFYFFYPLQFVLFYFLLKIFG
jgi:hypothetical protein